ncbi:MAG: tRNA uridine-5-carboxymethylaminomethyl(34) synthesis GTPase MnmE [Bdellovibrionales bacterium]
MSLFSGDRENLIICAVSTPPGFGGISVIRISGEGCFLLVRKSAQLLPEAPVSHHAYLAFFNSILDNSKIDQCLFTYFSKGKSFTGEETVEISCHGNPTICDRILQELIRNGASTALPGEFTFRAFMNGKLDLIQAEAILSLIESRSKRSAEISLRQLIGGVSQKILSIEDKLTWCLAHIEASIDFSTEGLETVSPAVLLDKLNECLEESQILLSTYQKGRMIRDGVQIAILGQPNVGKSSLLNRLLGYERSIVTDIAGTTRDIVSEEIVYMGQKFVFLDTAGIRKTSDDKVEKIGIQRSFEAALKADLVLFVFDSTLGLTEIDFEMLSRIKTKVILIGNKSDLLPSSSLADSKLKIVHSDHKFSDQEVLFCSTFDTSSPELVLQLVYENLIGEVQTGHEALLSNSRHFEGLSVAANKIADSLKSLKSGMGPELVSLDLKEALMCLQLILGKHFDDQIMDRVFKEFCIGK